MLDIWPALPIVVRVHGKRDEFNDNILGALKHHDRICEVRVDSVSDHDFEQLVGAMQVTFPALTHLHIHTIETDTASFPNTLLGGSAPNLRSLRLVYIAFPALPKLLLSCPGIVSLSLIQIPYYGYIPSDEMVDCLSSLTRLEHLQIDFQLSLPDPDRASRRPPSLKRTVFPVLRALFLKAETEYMDQVLAHIEAPYLNDARTEFLDLWEPPLMHITSPALPKLLLTSPGLVRLFLVGIPCPGYISSDEVVDCLSSLTRLERLEIIFSSSRPRPDNASPRLPTLTRTLFPVLTRLALYGVTEYLDQVLARIESPHLNNVQIAFSDPPIFDVSRLSPCIGPTETLEAFDQAWIQFIDDALDVALSSQKGTTARKMLTLSLQWIDSGWKLLKLDCRASSYPPTLSREEDFEEWTNDMGVTSWLDLLRIFTAVENLYLSMGVALCIAPALQELVGERVTEVLPALQTIVIARRKTSEAKIIRGVMGNFVAAREAYGHPVTVNVEWWKQGSESVGRSMDDI
jgi:hypothetical protein